MKKIPIKAAKEISKEYNQDQVILLTFDKKTGLTHVVTYGKTKEDCIQAAQGGNLIKEKILKWPADKCTAVPSRSEWKWEKTDQKLQFSDAKSEDIVWVCFDDEENGYHEGFARLIEGSDCFYFDPPIQKDCPRVLYYAGSADWTKTSSWVEVYKCKEIK